MTSRDLQEFLQAFYEAVSKWQAVSGTFGNDCVEMKRLVSGAYHDIWSENRKKFKDKCEEVLNKLWNPLDVQLEKPEDHFSSLDDYYRQRDKLIKEYRETPGVSS